MGRRANRTAVLPPLTIAFYAARFEVFGINATAQHALSLVLFGAVATLAGWFVLRLSGSAAMAVLTVLFYIVHPAMPYSLVAWVTNQMHLIESLVILSALIWWDAVRNRSVVWWLPLLGFAGAAFLIKEDGIMLLPCILVLHAMRGGFGDERLPPVPRLFIVASGGLLLLLITIRVLALGSAPSIRSPSIELALHNYVHGLNGVVRLVPADRRWQLAASWLVSLAPVAAMLMWRRLSPGARLTLLSGIAIALLFNVPFVFITKAEQMHVVALGAVLLLAAACAGLIEARRRGDIRGIVVAVCVPRRLCVSAQSPATSRETLSPMDRSCGRTTRWYADGWLSRSNCAMVPDAKELAARSRPTTRRSFDRARRREFRAARTGTLRRGDRLSMDDRTTHGDARHRPRPHDHDSAAARDRSVSSTDAGSHHSRRTPGR